jgi:uncharacterized protein (TIRG00374 family)
MNKTGISINDLPRKLLMGLVFGFLISTGLAFWGDIGKIGNSIIGFHWQYAPIICAFVTLGYLGRFLKWQLYLDELDVRIGWQDSARVFFSGLSMAITPGKVGEVLKSYLLLRQHKVSFCRSAPTVIAERLTDLIAMLVLASVAAHAVDYGKTIILVGTVMAVGIIVLLQWRRLATAVLHWLDRIPFLADKAQLFSDMYESAYRLNGGVLLFKAVFISILAWLCECIALYCILLGFGIEASLQVAMFVLSLASIAGGLSMLPGGLGVAEGSMIGLLVSCGVDFSGATGATLFARFGTLWFGVFLGIVSLLTNWSRFKLNEGSD